MRWRFGFLSGAVALIALAQFAYTVLFSYSSSFDGLTGLTIITLAILMATKARVKGSSKFGSQASSGLQAGWA